MTKPYLEISYREGKPFLAYLYLKGNASSVARSERVREIVIDFGAADDVVGFELLTLTPVAVATLREELAQRQIHSVTDSDLRPLIAA